MDIPVSSQDLDSVVYNVARDLVEQKAIDGKIDGITEENSQEVVNDVVFVIDRYMYYINEIISSNRLIQATSTKIK
jgi:hypothetical protein